MEEEEDEVDNSRKEKKEIENNTAIARDIFQLHFIVVSLLFFFFKNLKHFYNECFC